jgi:hypothetical protein
LRPAAPAPFIHALEAAGGDKGTRLPNWVKVSPLRRQLNLHRKFSPQVINRVLAAMRAPGGPAIAEYRQRLVNDGKEQDDFTRPTGTYRLKGVSDED